MTKDILLVSLGIQEMLISYDIIYFITLIS